MLSATKCLMVVFHLHVSVACGIKMSIVHWKKAIEPGMVVQT